MDKVSVHLKELGSIHDNSKKIETVSNPLHWSNELHETTIATGRDGLLHIVILGGADNASFCWISSIDDEKVNYRGGQFYKDEIILEVQGEKVAGFTLQDLLDWLWAVSDNGNPVLFKTVNSNLLPKSLYQYLSIRFQKNSLDYDLQQTIRKNVYKRTLPYTTRLPRPGELDGVDYKFFTVDEFLELEKSGDLLEKGIYDGNYYGTPKPTGNLRLISKVNDCAPFFSASGYSARADAVARTAIFDDVSMDKLSKNVPLEPPRQGSNSDARLQRSTDICQKSDSDTEKKDSTERGTISNCHRRSPRKSPQKDFNEDLPYGWEKVIDPHHGVYYVDHINKRTQFENPVASTPGRMSHSACVSDFNERAGSDKINSLNKSTNISPPAYKINESVLVKNNVRLRGEFIKTQIRKSPRGLGFTIIGAEGSELVLLQIKTIVPNGPAYADGKLLRGDVLVSVNSQCVIGFTHQDVVNVFQSIPIGNTVSLEVCRGYQLPFDPDDPSTEIVTTVAVTLPSSEQSSHSQTVSYSGSPNVSCGGASTVVTGCSTSHQNSAKEKSNKTFDDNDSHHRCQQFCVCIRKGSKGFGFTVADGSHGQKVKQILDPCRCEGLQEGDILLEVNGLSTRGMPHADVVDLLKSCPKDEEATMVIQRKSHPDNHKDVKSQKHQTARENSKEKVLEGSVARNASHSPVAGGSRLGQCADNRGNRGATRSPVSSDNRRQPCAGSRLDHHLKDSDFPGCEGATCTPDFIPASVFRVPSTTHKQEPSLPNIKSTTAPVSSSNDLDNLSSSTSKRSYFIPSDSNQSDYDLRNDCVEHDVLHPLLGAAGCDKNSGFDAASLEASSVVGARDDTTNFSRSSSVSVRSQNIQYDDSLLRQKTVYLERYENGFGIRIVGGIEEGSQVSIGFIVPGGAAEMEGQLEVGDEIVAVDGQSTVAAAHHDVVQLMSLSARNGHVLLEIRKPDSLFERNEWGFSDSYDVTLTRPEKEGFGFIIISAMTKSGASVETENQSNADTNLDSDWFPSSKQPYPWLGNIIEGSPASRSNQLSVGDRILAINGVKIAYMKHQEVVNLIRSSGLSIVLTVLPAAMYKSQGSLSHFTELESSQCSDLYPLPSDVDLSHCSKYLPYQGQVCQKSPLPNRLQMDSMHSMNREISNLKISRNEPADDKFIVVDLQRGARGFGFSIRGGKEFNNMPLYVLKIADDGPAQQDGRLKVGDQIIEINGFNTTGILHKDAIDIIQASGVNMRLLVKRSSAAWDIMNDISNLVTDPFSSRNYNLDPTFCRSNAYDDRNLSSREFPPVTMQQNV